MNGFGAHQYGREIEWYPEPHIAEKVFQEMVPEAKTVTVFYQHRLKEKGGLKKRGNSITEIRMENGSVLHAAIFVDASLRRRFDGTG